MVSRSQELEQFKREINFCLFAASYGFEIDPKKSGRSSAVLKHPNGDKLVVSKSKSGHWVYFNVHGDDKGTIIDFVKERDGSNLGMTRKKLRPWIGGISVAGSLPEAFPNLTPSKHDAIGVMRTWSKAKSTQRHPYLENQRKIPTSILSDPVFLDRFRIDVRGNALFPHWNDDSMVCGFEIKNRGFTGFSTGGVKGLWCSRPRETDNEMILCETAIDALSFAAIYGTQYKRFFSTAGQLSPGQEKLLISAAKQMDQLIIVRLAMDNDDGGRKLASKIRLVLDERPTGIMGLEKKQPEIVDFFPATEGEDFNDVLKRKQSGTLSETAELRI